MDCPVLQPAPLLQVERLAVTLAQTSSALLHDISFTLAPGHCLGVIGESGSGKSLLCRAIMGLLAPHFSCQGGIRFADTDLLMLNDAELRHFRGQGISLIPQHPLSAFDPLQSIGQQMMETFCTHQLLRPREAKEKALMLLHQVGLLQPMRRFDDYPGQLSGGMLQRVAIAIALGLSPRLLIADEPTASLDTVAQAEIVQLFARVRAQQGTTLLLVSHDLGVIRHLADEVIVMHQGRLVERGDTDQVLCQPQHGHTRQLVAARQALLQHYPQWLSAQPPQGTC